VSNGASCPLTNPQNQAQLFANWLYNAFPTVFPFRFVGGADPWSASRPPDGFSLQSGISCVIRSTLVPITRCENI